MNNVEILQKTEFMPVTNGGQYIPKHTGVWPIVSSAAYGVFPNNQTQKVNIATKELTTRPYFAAETRSFDRHLRHEILYSIYRPHFKVRRSAPIEIELVESLAPEYDINALLAVPMLYVVFPKPMVALVGIAQVGFTTKTDIRSLAFGFAVRMSDL